MCFHGSECTLLVWNSRSARPALENGYFASTVGGGPSLKCVALDLGETCATRRADGAERFARTACFFAIYASAGEAILAAAGPARQLIAPLEHVDAPLGSVPEPKYTSPTLRPNWWSPRTL